MPITVAIIESLIRKRQASNNTNNTQFTTDQIVMQLPGFPRNGGESSLQVAVTIGIPEPLVRLLPQSTTMAISLGCATQFFFQTGRSFVRVAAYDNNSNGLIAGLATSITLLLILLIAGALTTWYACTW